ncbi:unnamed protein product [Caenorhabditis nigoni]
MSSATSNEIDKKRYVTEGVKNLMALSKIAKLKERENELLRNETQTLREENETLMEKLRSSEIEKLEIAAKLARTVELERERIIYLKNIEVLRERVEELENAEIDVNRRECGTQVEVLELSVSNTPETPYINFSKKPGVDEENVAILIKSLELKQEKYQYALEFIRTLEEEALEIKKLQKQVEHLTKEKTSFSDDTRLREEIGKLIKCMEELSEGRRIEDLPESFQLEPPAYYYSSDLFSRTVDILKTIMKGGRFPNNMINDFWCSLIQRAEQIELVIKDKTEKAERLAGDEIIRMDIIHEKEKKAFRIKLQETEKNLLSSIRELEEYKKATANATTRSESNSKLTTGSDIPSSTVNEHQERFDNLPNVTLASSKGAWKPDRQKTAEDIPAEEAAVKEVCKKVRALMNKVTPTSQGPLTAEFISYNVSSNKSQLAQVAEIVLNKAAEEPKFCALYAEMCKAQVTHELPKNNERSPFRNTILTRTQSFFQDKRDIDIEKLAVIEKEDPVKREAMLIEEKQKVTKRKLGVTIFIGYLYRNSLLTTKIVQSCSLELFASILPKKIDEKEQSLNKEDFDEESIHCGLQLIETVGDILDKSAHCGPAFLDQWFKKLEDAKPLCSNKIRFMITDLNELRKDKWVSRKKRAQAAANTKLASSNKVDEELTDEEKALRAKIMNSVKSDIQEVVTEDLSQQEMADSFSKDYVGSAKYGNPSLTVVYEMIIRAASEKNLKEEERKKLACVLRMSLVSDAAKQSFIEGVTRFCKFAIDTELYQDYPQIWSVTGEVLMNTMHVHHEVIGDSEVKTISLTDMKSAFLTAKIEKGDNVMSFILFVEVIKRWTDAEIAETGAVEALAWKFQDFLYREEMEK